MRRQGTIATVAGLGVSDHVCWSYDDESALRAAAVTFLREGAELGLRLAYVADRPADALLADLAPLPDRDVLVERGALLVLPLGDRYDVGRPIDAEEQASRYEDALHQAWADGFAGLRIVADGTALARDPARRAALARWEQLADERVAAGRPISALCAYDRRVLGDGAIDDVLCVHPLVHRDGEQPPFRLFADGAGIALHGEVDVFAAAGLERVLAASTVGGAALDVSRLRFIDHHGVIALARHAASVAEARAALTIRGASRALRHAWDVALDGDAPPVRWA
ncbi:MAG TPA: MEDS domain-containing protein [Capillimicrobium sp.]|nr:MEDS domain-containing protein [Capillimicrobium sp.]